MTTQIKGYAFEVPIASSLQPSVVLADQIRSLDWVGRKAAKKCVVSVDELESMQAMCKALIG